MINKNKEKNVVKSLDNLSYTGSDGCAYWSAREIQVACGYRSWDDFFSVYARALEHIQFLGMDVRQHVHVVNGEQYISKYVVYYVCIQSDMGQPFVSRVVSYLVRTAMMTERQRAIAARNREIFLDDEATFSVPLWAEAYMKEKCRGVLPVQKFRTLVHGLMRKTASRSYVIAHARLLDMYAGTKYNECAVEKVRLLLRHFKFVRNR